MGSTTKQKEKLIEMIGALEAQLRHAGTMARVLEHDLPTKSFSDYMSFRRKIDEMRSLSAVIEMRLDDFNTFDGTSIDDLRHQFRTLDGIMIKMLLRCATVFFGAQRERRGLPLGVGDLLPAEIRVFREIAQRLAEAGDGSEGGDTHFSTIELIVAQITELQERTPSLPDFSQDPTETERRGGPRRLKRLSSR